MTICWALCSRLWLSSTLGFSSSLLLGVDHVEATPSAESCLHGRSPLDSGSVRFASDDDSFSGFLLCPSFFNGRLFDWLRLHPHHSVGCLLCPPCFLGCASYSIRHRPFYHLRRRVCTGCTGLGTQRKLPASNWSVLKSIQASITLNRSCPVIVSLYWEQDSQKFLSVSSVTYTKVQVLSPSDLQ